MAILFELSENIVKRAALISSKFPDRSLLSIIEECFEYGARSLYSDAPKPVPVKRVITEAYTAPVPPEPEYMESLQTVTNSIAKQAQENMDAIERVEDRDDSYTDPIISSSGVYEL
jgi:hypothetical protein